MLLSRAYAPSAALKPYARRYYVFRAELPPTFELIDQLLSETAFIRVLLQGNWAGETASNCWSGVGPVPLFGANGKPFRVRVRGPFHVVGIAIRPSGWGALFDCPASDVADRMVALADHWGRDADRLYEAIRHAADDASIVAGIEDVLRARLAALGRYTADPGLARFEAIARNDSTTLVGDAAAELGLSVRHLERQCRAAFGHSPKAILRRSRFLDMASALRGFSDPSAEDLAALRYADQSHKNREFRHFIGMPPGKFEKATTPLLTAGLKLRADGIS